MTEQAIGNTAATATEGSSVDKTPMPSVKQSVSEPVGMLSRVYNFVGKMNAEADKVAPSAALIAAGCGLAVGIGLPLVACMAVLGVSFGVYKGTFQNALKNPLEESKNALTSVVLAAGTGLVVTSGVSFIAAVAAAGALAVGVLGAKAMLSSSPLAAVRHEANVPAAERSA